MQQLEDLMAEMAMLREQGDLSAGRISLNQVLPLSYPSEQSLCREVWKR
jgi:hypothetical protein